MCMSKYPFRRFAIFRSRLYPAIKKRQEGSRATSAAKAVPVPWSRPPRRATPYQPKRNGVLADIAVSHHAGKGEHDHRSASLGLSAFVGEMPVSVPEYPVPTAVEYAYRDGYTAGFRSAVAAFQRVEKAAIPLPVAFRAVAVHLFTLYRWRDDAPPQLKPPRLTLGRERRGQQHCTDTAA